MKKLNIVLLVFPLIGVTLSAAPCQHGQHTHNPHCHADISQTTTQQSGIVDTHGNTPDPSTTNTHTGSVTPTHQNAQLVPVPKQPKPHAVPNQVVTGTYAKGPSGYAAVPQQPQPTPHAIPHQVPNPVPNKQPMAIPNQVPNQVVTGTYTKGPSGYAPVRQHQILITPHTYQNTVTHTVTHTGTKISGQVVPLSRPTHHFTTANKSNSTPITSGNHPLKEGYGFNIIEPGIQNKEVAVYRSNDARQMKYKDTIEIDNSGGFLLMDHGTRDPVYVR